MEKNHAKREVEKVRRQEERLLKKRQAVKASLLEKKLDEKVPEKLKETLDAAFTKAFVLVFEKGTSVIEKTYNKKQYEQDYQVRSFAVDLERSKKNLRTFSRQASVSRAKNMVVSGVEGIGLGVLGIGIPDIPIFTGVLLKSVYEISLSYGFSYDTKEEQEFILSLVEVSLKSGDELVIGSQRLDEWIEGNRQCLPEKNEAVKSAAAALSEQLLYTKFLQGLPIVGMAGGVFDAVCLKKVTEFADIKYKKRFFLTVIQDAT